MAISARPSSSAIRFVSAASFASFALIPIAALLVAPETIPDPTDRGAVTRETLFGARCFRQCCEMGSRAGVMPTKHKARQLYQPPDRPDPKGRRAATLTAK